MAATVEITCSANHAGTVELLGATLTEPGPTTPNLLPGGGFDRQNTASTYPLGWSRPQKYRYFPPGIYYIFNTWHNSSSDNRGTASRDTLVRYGGLASLRMLVPSGDETCVVSDPVPLNQTVARLIEVRAWVKTHQLGMLQIDAEDEAGRRLDGFNFIHKNPLSIGTDGWRQLRQVFRPTAPLKSNRLRLCARGTNGYTLDDTGHQPQQNACGIIWWDSVQLFEPETPAAELAARGVKPVDHLTYLRTAPMVAAVSRGPEEAFGYFAPMDATQLKEVESQAAYLRQATGKPVMVGHGGYWTRLEFEQVPFFDVFDPETEPWYPAPLHTDLAPLVAGKAKTIWLRPQMYESVPYERWRYHVLVELMRGARGWQVAHGPGDASTMRGLHAELRRLQPAIYSQERPPAVTIEPDIENMVRRANGRTVIIAATTHGMAFGNWRWTDEQADVGRVRVTADPQIFRDESDGYHATGEPAAQSLCPHGIQYLVHPKPWPAGSKLVTWVKFDPNSRPKSLAALVKADGRWAHAAGWGSFDATGLQTDEAKAYWFLRTFYRHARGFLGWGAKVPAYARKFIPAAVTAMGALPAAGEWVKLEVPLDKLDATGKLLDGVAFLHDGGRAWWASTGLVAPDGRETMVFGDHEDRPDPASLEEVKFAVAGLKKGAIVRVLFEDREIRAEDGFFVDDMRGVDLYQRYGGERTGYGASPVAMRVYEVP